MKTLGASIFSVAFCLMFWSCTKDKTAGGTMETENSVAFRVLDSLGNPAQGISARIRPAWYLGSDAALSNEQSIRNLTSDEDGWIHCDSLPLGLYRIEVGDKYLASTSEVNHSDTSTSQLFASLVLQKTGLLQGWIPLPENVPYAWVQIFGSDLRVRTDGNGRFEFDGIPHGSARIVALSPVENKVLAEDLAVIRPGQLVQMGQVPLPTLQTEDPYTWKFSKQLLIDSLIPAWMQPISDTTVITLHLSAETFNFLQSTPNGSDLRFYDAWDRPLISERVRWEPDLGLATVRVRIHDIVLDSTYKITMRWGHSGAVDPDTTGLWENVPDSIHSYLTKLTFGDFESGVANTDLPTFLPPSSWYIRIGDSNTTSVPSPYDDITTAFVSAGKGRTGNAAHVTYKPSATYAWVLIGTGIPNNPCDFSTLDSIVFYARGNGTLTVAFDNLDEDPNVKAITEAIDLDSVWTRVRILPSDFMPSDTSREIRDWSVIQDSVTNLTFFASKGNEFWIDSVVLYGVGVEDLR